MTGLIILWIIVITSFTIFGSWYVRKYNKPDALIGLYISFITISNILAYKIASFDLGFTTLFASAGVITFSVTFLITDIVNEKFGRKETHKMIFIAFLTQIAITVFIWLAVSLPSAPFWNEQEIFEKIFNFIPRILLASWVAFLISENLDAYLFSWFKKLTKGRYLWTRNIFSSLPSMAIDTIIFVFIAFYGVRPILPLFIGILVIKWLVGLVNIPFMYLNRWIMYK